MSSTTSTTSTTNPALRRAPVAKSTAHRPEAILGALDIQVPLAPPPAGYGWALAGLAAFLIVITAAYISLVTFLGWLTVWHVWQTVVSLQHGPYFIFHLPMALLGFLLFLFLIKPVFFRRKSGNEGILTLRAEDEPLLFAFVNKLADVTGARRPDLIEVDCEPNAGARLKRTGITGALGKGLVLRLGLPLVAAMTVRQFAGVLAHELGHFRQKGGMKGSYLIRLQVAFFARIVFERDRLDEKLERMRYGRNQLGRILFWAAGWLVEAARGVLWLMMLAGEALTCGVLRRMEYDADRVEAQVAGTREFLTTSRLMLFLSLAARRARGDLADAWEQRRLADDLPRLIVAHARQLSEHKSDILKLLDAEKTSWFDTHPCHADRCRSVDETGAKGLLVCEVGAKHLFQDFNTLALTGTARFYRSMLKEDLDTGKLIPTAELVEQRKGERENWKALSRFFRHGVAMTRPILPEGAALDSVPPGQEQAEIDELVAAREQMLSYAEVASASSEQYEKSNATCVINKTRAAFAGLFHSDGANKLSNSAHKELRIHDPLRLKSIHQLQPFEAAARRRLTAGLRLARTPPWASDPTATASLPATARATNRPIGQLIGLTHLLQPHAPTIERLREISLSLRLFFGAYDSANPYPPLVKRILQFGEEAVRLIAQFRADMHDIPFPFAHATRGISVANAIVDKTPTANDPVEIHAACQSAVDRFYDLIYRSLAELTTHAERIERAIGLEALPDVEPKEDKAAQAEEKAENQRNTRKYWLGYSARAVGGMAMLCMIIWMSVSPPALPSLGWGKSRGESGYAYRPAGFSMNSRSYSSDYTSYAPPPAPRYGPNYNPNFNGPNYQNPGYPNNPRNPNNPGFPNNNPGYRPSQPSYQPSYPSRGVGGGYSPPGGGGYSPPGGGGRR